MGLSSNSTEKLNISEIFYSIQGEGAFAGFPCIFIRLNGCNLRCSWCDTTYSYSNGIEMDFEEILANVTQFNCNLVEITGGEPLIQSQSLHLFHALRNLNKTILLETNGSVSIADVPDYVHIILDIKAPASNMSNMLYYENLSTLKKSDEIKIVIADRKDFEWAEKIITEFNLLNKLNQPITFQAVFNKLSEKELASWILRSGKNYKLGVQLHKYIYGENTLGV